MKLFKNKYFYAVIFTIALVFIANIKEAFSSFPHSESREQEVKEYCAELYESTTGNDIDDLKKEELKKCQLLLEYDVYTPDGYTEYINILEGLGFDLFMFFVCPLLITISFSFYVCKLFKSKIIKSYLLREDYNKFLKRIFLYSYKSTLIIPIFLIITFLCSWYISGHLIYQPFASDSGLPIKILDGMPLNAIPYILNIIFVYGIVVSLGLINASKNKNPLLVIIETFIMFVLLEFFNEIILEPFLYSLNIDPSGLLFLNLYDLVGAWSIWTCTLELFIYNVVVFFFVYLSYKNKENLLQMCES